jgi:hypothetical protein
VRSIHRPGERLKHIHNHTYSLFRPSLLTHFVHAPRSSHTCLVMFAPRSFPQGLDQLSTFIQRKYKLHKQPQESSREGGDTEWEHREGTEEPSLGARGWQRTEGGRWKEEKESRFGRGLSAPLGREHENIGSHYRPTKRHQPRQRHHRSLQMWGELGDGGQEQEVERHGRRRQQRRLFEDCSDEE